MSIFGSWLAPRRVEARCELDIERSFDSFHAYAVPVDVEINPGDVVLLQDPPAPVAPGGHMTGEGRITVRRAGPIAQAWTRAVSIFFLTSLYEVGFEAKDIP
ncbi:hypothetical protein [Lichenicoccus roseus]|uniref:Uncharacterized protein n=1 Tax=Lichenicoccus roseus TaxID=2683649 RepID=A0A5R9J8Z9_9PROT|nr:hypothetical protein [Lichenicoccus roseus]TLU74065.1 hypothetical protein FE263_02300 [Lichenicoccus roseus]